MTVRLRFTSMLRRPEARRWAVLALWTAAAAAAALRIAALVADPTLPGVPWQTSDGNLEDFRDIVWTPGRYVLDGGNPYDPVPYLAAHPWAQQFSAYPPVWLLLGVSLGPLPFLVSAVVFQVLALAVAVVLMRVLCAWALPRVADLAVPAGLLWINVWYPGRGALAGLGSVLAVLGVVLVLRCLTATGPRAAARGGRAALDAGCALGVALALVKPQFGLLVLIIAVAGGRIREAWRGVLGLVMACVPMFVVVSVAAGGPLALLASVRRNQEYVWGQDTPAGLDSPFQRRVDLFGSLAHLGLTSPPAWLTVAVPLAAIGVAVLAVRRVREPFLVCALVCTAILLGVFHPWYDLLLMIVPLAVGLGAGAYRRAAGVATRVAFAANVVVVVHLHTVSTRLVPGLTSRTADTIDFLLVVLVALSAAVAAARRLPHPAGSRPGPAAGERAAPPRRPGADRRRRPA